MRCKRTSPEGDFDVRARRRDTADRSDRHPARAAARPRTRVEDFEFETHESGFQELFGGGGILAVRCRSTGEERLYATGADSAWLGAFMMDLGAGHFAAFSRDVA